MLNLGTFLTRHRKALADRAQPQRTPILGTKAAEGAKLRPVPHEATTKALLQVLHASVVYEVGLPTEDLASTTLSNCFRNLRHGLRRPASQSRNVLGSTPKSCANSLPFFLRCSRYSRRFAPRNSGALRDKMATTCDSLPLGLPSSGSLSSTLGS